MKPNKLVILSRDADQYLELINQADLPELSIKTGRNLNEGRKPLEDCDIILGTPGLVRQALPHAPRLKWVQSMWAGITPLMETTLRRDYVLTGVKGVFGQIMAEYVICHLLMHERKSLERFRKQLKKQWDPTPPGTLQGKRIGIMGLGSIGSAVATTARFFGMKTRGFSRSRSASEGIDECFLPDRLMEFVRDLDYLVSVLPDTPETCGLIDESFLRAMADTALLINVGRGNVINEPALARALEQGEIAGAVLDVFQKEPLPPAHPFWETPNTIITSHTAAMSFPALVAPVFIDNYQRFVKGEPLNHKIDFNHGY